VHAGLTRGREADLTGVGAGLQGRLRLTGGLGVEALVEYRRDVFEEGGQQVLVVSQLPVQVSVQVFFLTSHPVQPYVLGGGTYVLVMSKGRGPNEGFSRTESKIGLHGGLGVDYRAGRRTMVRLDARYVSVDYDFGTTLTGRRGSFVSVNAGVDWLF
jgi:outer membrane protein W